MPFLVHSVQEKIYQQLGAKELKDAVCLMVAAREIFPEVAIEKRDSEQEEGEESVTMDTLACLKHVFMGGLCFILQYTSLFSRLGPSEVQFAF